MRHVIMNSGTEREGVESFAEYFDLGCLLSPDNPTVKSNVSRMKSGSENHKHHRKFSIFYCIG